MEAEDRLASPWYDADLGRYRYDAPPQPAAIEPAFVRVAVESDFELPRHDVTTFADTYPRGARGSLTVNDSVAPPTESEEFDALADWRVPGEVADSILISLPDGTPRMLRTLLTLLLGGMRHR